MREAKYTVYISCKPFFQGKVDVYKALTIHILQNSTKVDSSPCVLVDEFPEHWKNENECGKIVVYFTQLLCGQGIVLYIFLPAWVTTIGHNADPYV